MMFVRVANQRVAQVAIATGQQSQQLVSSPILATRNRKQIPFTCVITSRTLVQSTAKSQKVTTANNQQLIPVARNISFRQCQLADRKRNATETSAKALFSMSASSSASDYYLNSPVVESFVTTEPELPFGLVQKRKETSHEKQEPAAGNMTYYVQSANEAIATTNPERKLVVLLSWLQAREKHIEKYRQFYLDRGFDVLNVKTSPLDLLLPNFGAKKISENFVRFMVEKQYSDVVVHGFSVGGYMFGRFLLEMEKQTNTELHQKLISSIRGIVFDSLVPIEGTCIGVANSITENKLGAKIVEKLLELYLFLGYNIATKYFEEVSDKVWSGPLRCPTLFLNSREDKISDHKIVEHLAEVWSGLGIETHKMLVDKAPHVQLFAKHHNKYVEQVESFLNRIQMAQQAAN